MLSRVAENLYWLGRYLERADNLARLTDAHTLASVEQVTGAGTAWTAVVEALGATEAYEAARAAQPMLRREDFVIRASDCPQSARAVITSARSLARELREEISREVFEEINRLYLESTDADAMSLREFTANIRRRIASTIGLFDHTVLRTDGSAWFRCGMYLERADMTSRIVDSKYFVVLPEQTDVGSPLDRAQWRAVLSSASALEAFRRRHREAVAGMAVADLLLFDTEFPRSLTFCVGELRQNFELATMGSMMPQVVYPAREIILLQLDLRGADIRGAVRTGLHQFLDEFQDRLITVSQSLRDHVFHAYPEEPSSGGIAVRAAGA